MEALTEEVDKIQDNNKENVSTSQVMVQSQPPVNNTAPVDVLNKKPLPNVEIIYSSIPKPYLGGFKSLKTGLVYHHAFAQTDQIPRDHKTKYHRDVYNFF